MKLEFICGLSTIVSELKKRKVRNLFRRDMQKKNISTPLPYALAKKYPNAGLEFGPAT